MLLAANSTRKTQELLKQLFVNSPDFSNISNKVNLSDRTVLIRLALINLLKNKPSLEDIQSYKAALIKPVEFDAYLEEFPKREEVISN